MRGERIMYHVQVYIHAFITSTLDAGEWLTSHTGCFNPGKEPYNSRIGGLDVSRKTNISNFNLDSNPGTSSP